MNTFDYTLRLAVAAAHPSLWEEAASADVRGAGRQRGAQLVRPGHKREEVRVQAMQLRVVQLQRRADHGRPGVHLRLLAHPGRVAALERGDLGADVRHAHSQSRHEGRDLAARRSQRLDAVQQARALRRRLGLLVSW